jgi:ribosomal protein S18 acetylase RimI-like enzyme
MRVRPVVGTDIPAIRDVLVRTWHDTYDAIYGAERVTEITDRWHSIANLTRQLVRPLSTFLVAESAGRILGTAKGVADDSGGVTLERLYVDPAAQRAGVGCQLLNAMLAAYPLAPDVRVEVEPRNEKAVAFYRGHGFEPAGKTADCGGDSGYAADRMRKILREGRPDRAPALMLRPVRDADAQDLIGLIAL